MYVNDRNGNGKRGGDLGFLGEVGMHLLGDAIPSRLGSSVFQVLARRIVTARGVGPGGSPYQMPARAPARAPIIDAARRVTTPIPSINVVSLPNGTAVPAAILPAPSSNGGAPAGGGGSFGPPSSPVEVGTLPGDGDSTSFSTAGVSSLAGLTSNPMVLGLIAVAAFIVLDGKPKRQRRR